MSDIHDQIAQRIKAFAGELEELVRQAAIDAVAKSLGQPTKSAGAPRASAPRAAAPRAARKPGKGGKRPPALLAATVEKTSAWIKANPGHGVEDMAKGLGLATKELTLPIAKLLKAKTIRKKGQKRATKYFPA